MIYHLLPELEPFSAVSGGALSRDAANIMHWNPTDMVACLRADESWGYSSDRILVIPRLRIYNRIKGRRFLPIWLSAPLVRWMFQPLLERLQAGDIVWNHNQLVFSAGLGQAIRQKGAKLVHHFHDGHVPPGSLPALKSFRSDAEIFVSDYLRQQWLKVYPAFTKTYAVPNGADDVLFFPRLTGEKSGNSVPTVLYVGRLHPEKGIQVLIEAMKILQERKVEAFCRVVGSAFSGGSKSTPFVDSLMKSSPSNVSFVGHRSGKLIAEEYRASDIFCCPSIWQEPFGNVNIEAMASGIPVVATRVGGITEIAAEGGVLLVEPGSPEAIADALQRLIQDEELRRITAEAGRSSFLRRYTWEAVCQQYQAIMDSV